MIAICRVSPHSTGIGALVVVEGALVVPGRDKRKKCAPSASTMTESSCPVRASSNIILWPPSPRIRFSITLSTNDRASTCDPLTSTPLPRASRRLSSPAANRHAPARGTHRRPIRKTAYMRAVGMLWRSRNCLAKTLLPSSCAHCLRRADQAQSSTRKFVGNPSTSGCSGPTTVRSAPRRAASSAKRRCDSQVGQERIPRLAQCQPFPGAHQTFSTDALNAANAKRVRVRVHRLQSQEFSSRVSR